MPFPFGGHPRLSDYLSYAESVGCKISRKSGMDHLGCPVDFLLIEASNGKHVIVAGVPDAERLEPAKVSFLNRRLGLTSPFASAPSHD